MGRADGFRPANADYVKAGTAPPHYPPEDRPEIAFIGRSNVGKSSLINGLTARKALARTSRTPGRTQAIQFFAVDPELYFADLPGYGYAKVPKKLTASCGKDPATVISVAPAMSSLSFHRSQVASSAATR